jgi:polyisoprenyl-phosphate glycosyltransferase
MSRTPQPFDGLAGPVSTPVGISVVVPVYRAADCIEELYSRLVAVLEQLPVSFELVWIEDCGGDESWTVMSRIAARDPRLRIAQLSRNFGQHAAITAGLELAEGAWVVVMDCDLQDPPEDLPRLYERALEGHDVVLARRVQKQMPWFRRMAAHVYFAAMRRMSGTHLDGDFGSFSLISRQVCSEFLRFSERERHYLFILQWLGFPTAVIDVQHAPRFAGRSSYSMRTLVRHAFAGMFFQTTTLLRSIVLLGFIQAIAGLVLAAVFVVQRLANDQVYPGWTSLAVLVLVTGGLTITSMGVIGLYVGRVFDQVKGRPLYVVGRTGADTDANTPSVRGSDGIAGGAWNTRTP